jgi:iron(III) transport system substrate-binding protein
MSTNLIPNDIARARKLHLRLKIFLGAGAIAYFALLGVGGLHAGEAKPAAAIEWEKTVEAAKKEGRVVVSIPASTELRRGIEKAFKQRFGIEAELNVGRAASIVGRIQQESKSGVPGFDIHMGGGESMVTGLLSEGILAPLEPAMILKEVKDPSNWWGGHIWLDNAKRYIYASHAHQVELIWCNTDHVKPEEIRSLNDLLNPKWAGKIGYLDPRTPGAGASMWSFLWKLKGEDYLKKLVGQKLFLGRDQRVLAESLARGKIGLVVGLSYYSFLPFVKAGLPVKSISTPRDEMYVTGGSGNVTII